jgi:hypothetical protein
MGKKKKYTDNKFSSKDYKSKKAERKTALHLRRKE